MSANSRAIRLLVGDAVSAAADLIAHPEVAARWDEPSALADMTTGALAAHLVRAAGATSAYLDRTDPDVEPPGELLTAVTYFHAALDAPIHGQIREVSANESVIGADAMASKCRDLATALSVRLGEEPEDRMVGALGGRKLTLDDFCRTRLIEILLHIDDLAASIDAEPPKVASEGLAIVADVLVGIALESRGHWEVVRALARRERAETSPPVFPVF